MISGPEPSKHLPMPVSYCASGTRYKGKTRINLKLFPDPCAFIFKFQELIAKPIQSRYPTRQCTPWKKTLEEIQTFGTFTTQMPPGQSDILILKCLALRGVHVLVSFPLDFLLLHHDQKHFGKGRVAFILHLQFPTHYGRKSGGNPQKNRGRNEGGLLHGSHSVVIIQPRPANLGMVPPSCLGPPMQLTIKKSAQRHAQRPTWWRLLS